MEQPVLSRVQTRWMRLGLFQLINPIIKYQPGKANIVTNALSRSQRPRQGTEGDQSQHPEEAMVEEEDEGELFQSTESAIAIKTSEKQKWTDAYNEDAKLKAAIQELCKGHRCSVFSLLLE